MGIAVAVILLITVWEYLFYGDDPLARLLGQLKLLHLRAHFVHVPAKEARGLCDRPAVGDFVRQVAERRRKKFRSSGR